MCLTSTGSDKNVICIVTQVLVDMNDPAFTDPQKRIGKIYSKREADELAAKKGWIFREEVKIEGGFRRVVPSPVPVDIMNESIIRDLAMQGKYSHCSRRRRGSCLY